MQPYGTAERNCPCGQEDRARRDGRHRRLQGRRDHEPFAQGRRRGPRHHDARRGELRHGADVPRDQQSAGDDRYVGQGAALPCRAHRARHTCRRRADRAGDGQHHRQGRGGHRRRHADDDPARDKGTGVRRARDEHEHVRSPRDAAQPARPRRKGLAHHRARERHARLRRRGQRPPA